MPPDTRSATLLALAARAEVGQWTRADDATLAELLGWKVHTDREWHLVTSYDGTPESALAPIWCFDKSIDAQAELPGVVSEIAAIILDVDTGQEGFSARVYPRHKSEAPTEALARLSALLRAASDAPRHD